MALDSVTGSQPPRNVNFSPNQVRNHTLRLPLKVGGLAFNAFLYVALVGALWMLQPAAGVGISGATGVLFWACHIAVLLPLLRGSQAIVLLLPFHRGMYPVLSLALSGVLGSLAFTPFAMTIDALFSAPSDLDDHGSLLSRAASEFLYFVVPVTLLWILLNTRQLSRLSVPLLDPIEKDRKPTLTAQEAEFWSLLPSSLGDDVVALSAEQHYVRVYTIRGQTLVLFAFSRAVGAVLRFEGLQVHRSHWVRLKHVVDLSGTTRGLRCRLSNGINVPVSRGNVATLRQRLDARRHTSIADSIDLEAAGSRAAHS